MNNVSSTDFLIDIRSVSERINYGKSTIYRWIKEGKFPPPKKAGSRNRWRDSEVSAWMESMSTGH